MSDGDAPAVPTQQMPAGTIKHTKANQGSGYALGAIVLCDGILWLNLLASNDQWPGESYWTLYG